MLYLLLFGICLGGLYLLCESKETAGKLNQQLEYSINENKVRREYESISADGVADSVIDGLL